MMCLHKSVLGTFAIAGEPDLTYYAELGERIELILAEPPLLLRFSELSHAHQRLWKAPAQAASEASNIWTKTFPTSLLTHSSKRVVRNERKAHDGGLATLPGNGGKGDLL